MKLSLAPLPVLAAALALAGCGSSSSSDTAPAPAPTQTPAEETPAPRVRTLVEGTVMPASPVNLLADPGFALVGQGANYTSFLGFDEETSQPFDLEATLDSRAPSGFGGNVGRVRGGGSTILLASLPGGQGPFTAQVWFSRLDAKGRPADLPTDGSVVAASVTEESPEGKAYDLAVVPDATRTVAGRTWVLHRATIAGPLPFGGFFVLRVVSKDGEVQISAPQVTSAEIVAGAPIQSATRAGVRGRALASYERDGLRKFRSMKPRLVPAGRGARLP